MTTKQIFELISLCLSLLVPILAFVGTLVKVIRDKNWNVLKSALCDFVIKAEETFGCTGAEKKNMVLEWAKDFCQKEGIKFDAEQVSSVIEKLIDLSKRVNTKSKEVSQSPQSSAEPSAPNAQNPN